jgi:hypothetical protein
MSKFISAITVEAIAFTSQFGILNLKPDNFNYAIKAAEK